MSSRHANAPEVPGASNETSSEAQWSAAARSQEVFVYETQDDDGRMLSWHLMEWHPRPKRAYETGITGSARVLESQPCLGSRGRGEGEIRIHVCRRAPCRAKKNHPSKYGSTPCPEMHGCIVDWGRAAWNTYASGSAPEICINADSTIEQAAAVVAIASADSAEPPSQIITC